MTIQNVPILTKHTSKGYTVYAFLNDEGNPFYIGQTKYFNQRKQKNLSDIKNNKKNLKFKIANQLLDDKKNFIIQPLYYNLTKKQANTVELYYIENYNLTNQLKKLVSEKAYKHGLCFTQVYTSWSNMKNRCYNKNNNDYLNYGKRGICVCEKWKNSFIEFYKDIGDPPTSEHSLDRIDNEDSYYPDNCRWSTVSEQARNTRRNHRVTYKKITKTLIEWSEHLNVSYYVLRKRLHDGWDVEKAFEKPVNNHLKIITYKGETRNLKQWSKHLGINYNTLYNRIKSGWDDEKALSTKPKERK